MKPVAYIVTSKRGKQRLVFADSEGYRNAVLFKEKMEPLYNEARN